MSVLLTHCKAKENDVLISNMISKRQSNRWTHRLKGCLTRVLLPSDQQLLSQLLTPPPSCQPTRSLLRTGHETASSLNISPEQWRHPRRHSRHLPSSTASPLRHSRRSSQFLSQNNDCRLRRPPCLLQPEQEDYFRFDLSRIKCTKHLQETFFLRKNKLLKLFSKQLLIL